MGTNYYLHDKVCGCCGRGDEPLHIGKSSAGWCFSLHVEPDDLEFPHSLDEWRERWDQPTSEIKDEYGAIVTPADMLTVITMRSGGGCDRWPKFYEGLYRDWSEFHRQNGSEPGPNGLLRHQVNVFRCVGHGTGTWDLITGEFS